MENASILLAFKDLHNFWLSIDEYRSLFNEKYLEQRLPLENFDINNVYVERRFAHTMGYEQRINARSGIDTWNDKNYYKTRDENVEIFDEYLKLCEEKSVRPIICLPPFSEGYIKYFSRKKIDELRHIVKEAQKKYPDVVFFDGWKAEGFSDLDFADASHLNFQGAAKFSKMLNEVIEELEPNKNNLRWNFERKISIGRR